MDKAAKNRDKNGWMALLTEESKARLGIGPELTPMEAGRRILSMIDHTIIKPDATRQEVETICDEARALGFAAVCVNSFYIRDVAARLEGSGVAPGTTAGFPFGAALSEAKAFETRAAVAAGAREVDMVLNIGAAKAGEWELVQRDIEAVVEAAGGKALVKVILETGFLSDEEKIKACEAAKRAGAAFVKTSTGFLKGGATAADVALMRRIVGGDMGVKASGGVRNLSAAIEMINAGASRIGTSSGLSIYKELSGEQAG